ncbi:hypothetical protein ZIOFF_013313 [Zingiber officinale]|uniref:Uncharacterized protein n=1 Tax=Zingiber officinale TaxID=94328 RepID=A0A8J5LNT5_ZINOF|nr:hypothetical protein ZIOFF_013313 [Zingiber officinale]
MASEASSSSSSLPSPTQRRVAAAEVWKDISLNSLNNRDTPSTPDPLFLRCFLISCSDARPASDSTDAGNVSAAAYTNELEKEVDHLLKENRRLKIKYEEVGEGGGPRERVVVGKVDGEFTSPGGAYGGLNEAHAKVHGVGGKQLEVVVEAVTRWITALGLGLEAGPRVPSADNTGGSMSCQYRSVPRKEFVAKSEETQSLSNGIHSEIKSEPEELKNLDSISRSPKATIFVSKDAQTEEKVVEIHQVVVVSNSVDSTSTKSDENCHQTSENVKHYVTDSTIVSCNNIAEYQDYAYNLISDSQSQNEVSNQNPGSLERERTAEKMAMETIQILF